MRAINAGFAAATAIVFLGLNGLIVQKELIRNGGQVMLLKISTFAKDSPMRGKCMGLAYEIARQIQVQDDGYAVVRLDRNNVALFVRVHGGEPLQADERLLRFRFRDGEARLGADEYFFQESDRIRYERACYAELRVSPSGTALLTGLRGANFERMSTERSPP